MQKLEEKVEDWDSSLSAQDRSNAFPRLAWIRSTKKPKGTLSVKAHAKHEVTWKLSYLRPTMIFVWFVNLFKNLLHIKILNKLIGLYLNLPISLEANDRLLEILIDFRVNKSTLNI